MDRGLAKFSNLAITEPGDGYSFVVVTGPLTDWLIVEGVNVTYIGNNTNSTAVVSRSGSNSTQSYPVFDIFSDSFTILPIVSSAPDKVRVDPQVSSMTTTVALATTIATPFLATGAGAVVSPPLVVNVKASVSAGLQFHMLQMLVFLQMFIIPVQLNPAVSEVFNIFQAEQIFNADIDEGPSDSLFGYAQNLFGKCLALLILMILYVLTPGLYVRTCCINTSIQNTFFVPLFLMLYLLLCESLFVIMYDNNIYVSVLTLGLSFCVILVMFSVQRSFNNPRNNFKQQMPLGRGFKGLIYRPTRTLDDQENSIHDEEKGGVKAAPATTTSTTTTGSTGTTALSTTTTTNSNKETHRSNKKKRTIYDDDDNDSVEDGERVALSCFQELSARSGSCRWRFEIYRPSSTVARTMLHHRVMQSKVGEEDEEFTKEDKEKAQQYKKFEEDRLRWERYSWRPLFEDSVYYPDQEDLNDAIDAYREAKLKASNTFGVHQPRVRLGRIATQRKSFSDKWQRYKKRNEDEEDEEDEDDEEEGDEEKQKQRQKENELKKQQQLEEQKKQQQLQQQCNLQIYHPTPLSLIVQL